jgi:hypothetical protein
LNDLTTNPYGRRWLSAKSNNRSKFFEVVMVLTQVNSVPAFVAVTAMPRTLLQLRPPVKLEGSPEKGPETPALTPIFALPAGTPKTHNGLC